MNNKTGIKNFDAVAMMRSIRDGLSQEYMENPAKQKSDLEKIRKKYSFQLKQNSK